MWTVSSVEPDAAAGPAAATVVIGPWCEGYEKI